VSEGVERLVAMTDQLADSVHDLLQIVGWLPDELRDDTVPGTDLGSWRARKALHDLEELTGRDAYCSDDRDSPPPIVAWDLKEEALRKAAS
jgi:hypothetical protein